jgi:hypothetical protein
MNWSIRSLAYMLLYFLLHKEQNCVHSVVTKDVQNLIKQNTHNKTKYLIV